MHRIALIGYGRLLVLTLCECCSVKYQRLSEVLDYTYYGENMVKKETEIDYDSTYKLLASKRSYTNSSAQQIEELTYYPHNISSTIYNSMKTANMLDYPIETIEKRDGEFTQSTLVEYNSDKLPYRVFELAPTQPLTSFTLYNGTGKSTHYNTNPNVYCQEYNAFKKPEKVLYRDGMYTYYIYGYDGAYLLAKIETQNNIDVSSITIDDDDLNWTETKTEIDSDIAYVSNKVSTYLNSSGYLVTIYTYKPLVGLTSVG